MTLTQHKNKKIQIIAIALVIVMVCTLFTLPEKTYAETDDDTIIDIQEEIVTIAISAYKNQTNYEAGTSECLRWVKGVYEACDYDYETSSHGANDYGRAYYQYKTSTASEGDDIEETIQPGMFVAVEHTNTTAGQQYGHIGIYIGNGYVVHWIGNSVQKISLSSWMSSYYTGYKYGTNYLYWGYHDDILTAAADKCTSSIATGSTYDGTEQEPAVTVKYDGTTLTEGADYTLTYSNNIDAGTGKVKITGVGIFEGYTLTKSFTISKASISSATVTLAATSYTYTGSAITPTVKSVKVNGTKLTEGTDYTVSYSDNTDATTAAVVTITGAGNYTETKTKTFSIKKKLSSDTAISIYGTTFDDDGTAIFEYDGTAITPKIQVTYNGEILTAGTDYTVTYSNNTYVGTGTIKVTGKGTYSGTVSRTFEITEPDDASMYFLVVGYTWTKSVNGETVLYIEPYSTTSMYFYVPATGTYYQAVCKTSYSTNYYDVSEINDYLDFQLGYTLSYAKVSGEVDSSEVYGNESGYNDAVWIEVS